MCAFMQNTRRSFTIIEFVLLTESFAMKRAVFFLVACFLKLQYTLARSFTLHTTVDTGNLHSCTENSIKGV